MPMNLIRWEFTYIRSEPVESRMTRHEDFHPNHPISTVEWFAKRIAVKRKQDLRKDWESMALDLVLNKSCEIESGWNWGMILDTL